MVNIVLDPLFIFVFGWGVKGAAIATVLSQAVSAAWNVNFLMGKKSSLRLSFCHIRPDFRIMGQICSLGISPFIMRATESLISIVLNRGLQNGIQPTFLALGQAKISLFIAMFRKVILLVPLALTLPRFFGVMGIYYAEPISDIISAATACILFALNIKKILSKEYLARIH